VSYRIIFLKGENEIASKPWADRDGAIAHARDHFPIHEKQNGATSVKVIDVDAEPQMVVFSYPEKR